eukprot:s1060_g10.t1
MIEKTPVGPISSHFATSPSCKASVGHAHENQEDKKETVEDEGGLSFTFELPNKTTKEVRCEAGLTGGGSANPTQVGHHARAGDGITHGVYRCHAQHLQRCAEASREKNVTVEP